MAGNRLRIVTMASGALWLALSSGPVDAQEKRGESTFQQQVLPLLTQYCADCHGETTHGERWTWESAASYAELLEERPAWRKVAQLVSAHIMPPHDAEPLSHKQRQQLLDWIESVVFHVDPARPDPGPVTLRRLNRAEYNATIRDVLGLDSRPADQFPEDDSGYGFDNIGDVLTVSPLHVEKYLAAAGNISAELMRLENPLRVGIELTGNRLMTFAGQSELHDQQLALPTPSVEVGTVVDVPVTSVYRILTRAAVSRWPDEQLATLEVLSNGQVIAELQPTAEWQGRPGGTSTVFTLVELPAGDHRLGLRVKKERKKEQNDEQNESAEAAEEIGASIAFLGISGPFTPMPPPASSYLESLAKDRPLGTPILRLSGEDLDGGSGRTSLDTGRAWFASNGYRHAPVFVTQPGEYRLRFKVGAQQVGDEPVRFEVRLADRTLGPFSVTAEAQAEQWVEAICELPAGQLDWQVWFVNEYQDPQTGAERWFWLHEFTIEGPVDEEYGLKRDEVLTALHQTGKRLFRRPLTDLEKEKLETLVDSIMEAEESPRAAMQVAIEAMLASPKFLYHPLPIPSGERVNDAVPIDEWTLASRLSYFLWSSAPDEELLDLAERGMLRTEISNQVKRMLRDPRSRALTENFAGQWLQLRNLEHVALDARMFPEFDPELAADMRRESEMLFEHILRKNRSVLEFLTADYTFVNPRLARLYGLSEPEEERFQRVSLEGTPRRGVVNHASVLALTSHPTRTSPVKRGQWLLEQMLGVEPPPAPPDVPPLDETEEDESLPLRVRLEAHQSRPSCASCHALLDPMGYALEHYDALGRWRDRDGEHPVDASGELLSGESFRDWSELRTILVRDQSEDLVRCLVEHLLTYALGRGVTWRDKPAVAEVMRCAEPSQYGLEDLILAVVESVPFQSMR